MDLNEPRWIFNHALESDDKQFSIEELVTGDIRPTRNGKCVEQHYHYIFHFIVFFFFVPAYRRCFQSGLLLLDLVQSTHDSRTHARTKAPRSSSAA